MALFISPCVVPTVLASFNIGNGTNMFKYWKGKLGCTAVPLRDALLSLVETFLATEDGQEMTVEMAAVVVVAKALYAGLSPAVLSDRLREHVFKFLRANLLVEMPEGADLSLPRKWDFQPSSGWTTELIAAQPPLPQGPPPPPPPLELQVLQPTLTDTLTHASMIMVNSHSLP
jgi:hypothetical protein